MTEARARAIRALIEKASASLSDKDASCAAELFPAWQSLLDEGHTFTQEEVNTRPRLRYGDKLYVVTQPHTMQQGWTPDNAPSLYEEIGYRDGIRLIPAYITAANPFSKGERGMDGDGVIWISKVDNNVYTPTQYAQNWERESADAQS